MCADEALGVLNLFASDEEMPGHGPYGLTVQIREMVCGLAILLHCDIGDSLAACRRLRTAGREHVSCYIVMGVLGRGRAIRKKAWLT